MAALAALIIFMLAAFGVTPESFNIVYIGFALLALALLIGNWPFGLIVRSRQ